MTEEPLLLTVREAARILRIGRDLAYALVAQGRLPSVRLGRRLLIPREALLRWLEEEAGRRPESEDEYMSGRSVR